MTTPACTFSLLAAVVLAACASYSGYGLQPGASESDVRAAMGAPRVQFEGRDGTRELIYPHGPLGTQTHVAHLGKDGRLQGIEQVLDDDHFRAIHEGMTQDDVMRMIGPPGQTMRFSSGNYAWTYRFIDTWGYTSEFSVTFDPGGIVVSKISERLEPRDPSR